MQIYDYQEYKIYLKARLAADHDKIKGVKNKLSSFIGCQPSYLSQTLNGKPHLTLEQGLKLNEFFGHTKEESMYFLFMLEADRAGTQELYHFFQERMAEIKQARLNLKKRLKDTADLPSEDQHRYYSTWYYSAVHVILSIPDYQSPLKISEQLNIPLNLVNEAIDFLRQIGLIQWKKTQWVLTNKNYFLGRGSEFIQRHHINWRSQALQSVEKNLPEDMHYSNVFAISESDFLRIKEVLAQAIEQTRKIVGPSKEEALYAMTLDVFSL